MKNFDIYEEFIQKVDKPISICNDDSIGLFIKSDFNRESDSYRSPWSNKYFPEVEVPKFPPNELRELEIILNKLFKIYTRFYYGETAVSSVFVWEQGDSIENGFACALLVKNSK
jgi:capping protein beta